MKYYAVKNGRAPGIYETWHDCREQIYQYSGAVFKSFEDKAAAEKYLQEAPAEQPIKKNIPEAFIDGSYSKNNSCYSWGGFIIDGGQIHILQGTGNNPEYLPERNIAGELIGALQILFYCDRHKTPEINLYHDYVGIEAYTTGIWKAKTALAKYYKGMFELLSDKVKINFIRVKGHTGIDGNELADVLAKQAAGVKIRKKDAARINELMQDGRANIDRIYKDSAGINGTVPKIGQY